MYRFDEPFIRLFDSTCFNSEPEGTRVRIPPSNMVLYRAASQKRMSPYQRHDISLEDLNMQRIFRDIQIGNYRPGYERWKLEVHASHYNALNPYGRTYDSALSVACGAHKFAPRYGVRALRAPTIGQLKIKFSTSTEFILK